MPNDPYGDLIGLLLVLAAALFLAAVVWLLVRKYRAEQSHSLDCTLPKLASPVLTPMMESSPMMEEDEQQSLALENKMQNARAPMTPSVDTIHVLAKESLAAGESSDRLAETHSKSTVASKSDAGASQQPPAKPQDHPEGHGPPEGASEPVSRQKKRHRRDAPGTEDQRKPPSVAKDELKMERRASAVPSVTGDHTKPTAELKEQNVSKASTRRKQKPRRQEATSVADSAKPSTARKPEVMSTGLPTQEAPDATPGTADPGIASTVPTPASIDLATAKEDDSKAAEWSSNKSAERSLQRKTRRQAPSANFTRVPDVAQDAGGKPTAGGLNPALPPVTSQAIAASDKATAQDHALQSTSAGAVELTQPKDVSTAIVDATSFPRASPYLSPDSKMTTATISGGTDDFRSASSSPAPKDAGKVALVPEVDASSASVSTNETDIRSPSDVPTATAKSVSNSAEGIAKPVAAATDETVAPQTLLAITDKN
ncbi:polycystic kidney disease protein 1-like 3 [Dermacentor silvarum]|uniref:polycystic kidney disease protein 1-like 3 n=1 Tax=Dermacentor silvarum TaxID=543639 RepID=UPI002101218E|nr:polycystic kidney disease protein 1-like 3 [Dermacentor silvarum]